ncbi:Uma2 family endonuclease [Paraflavitalea speifideaquila]|uniref:Uma2 family endonuclease n=1 Tax=Paraflavitalea speifideaquila TaxID=3076558 RepID=UPI0028ED2776|nr:Uma2 family endonuclease [Paraflavitalea speifideiaquila]
MSIADKYRPQYTYADYVQWEGKWELIDGMPYAMSPSPVRVHQETNFNFGKAFDKAILPQCQACKVFMSPFDWKVNDNTVVQPDLMVVCGEFDTDFLEFAPSLVVEVLSPSTALKDRHEKFELYEQEGVHYYLIVDPKFKKVEIYQLIEGKYQPVSISPRSSLSTLKKAVRSMCPFLIFGAKATIQVVPATPPNYSRIFAAK